jgi:hypothetical protein
MEATRAEALPVYVSCEYGQLDEDQEFDQDDITWCQVFVEKGGQLSRIFEDETA